MSRSKCLQRQNLEKVVRLNNFELERRYHFVVETKILLYNSIKKKVIKKPKLNLETVLNFL